MSVGGDKEREDWKRETQQVQTGLFPEPYPGPCGPFFSGQTPMVMDRLRGPDSSEREGPAWEILYFFLGQGLPAWEILGIWF